MTVVSTFDGRLALSKHFSSQFLRLGYLSGISSHKEEMQQELESDAEGF